MNKAFTWRRLADIGSRRAKTMPAALALCVFVAVGLLSQSAWAKGPLLGGGPVLYKKYPGTAVITRVEKTEAANANKANASEGYEVWYTFTPKAKVSNGLGKSYLEQNKEHQFVIGSSGWCPGPKFLKKYGIEKGKKFAATLMVIVKGASTPVILKLDAVPDDDYFEAARSE